ncbi:cytochrome P450 [Methylobacterium haplocladii]|uniref:Cytochrome P450 n=1 Tax=Methylobacterium haplocladii TaxID=1176176 RepID=A0A512IQ35_9HYPH|nr:cytochrome P450 [Methylobacterium haplocladii]GEO99782.1 cytochrome P450 [Methylobacterium haplocladii]GJD84586.1 Putative cytochrome P450 132 [Methylobacterium haplocladii]GLS60016.1 cytochrome P450 [Methylobacterium haplocladii]
MPPDTVLSRETAPFRFRPVVPKPRTEDLGLFAFLKAARKNPITTWMRAHFEQPVVAADGVMGRITVVSDPALIRYLYVDNAKNYRKDDLQRRILAPGLGNGLLSAEGDEWRNQRRTIAPIFSPRHVMSFAEPMNLAGARVARRLARRDGAHIEAANEMTRVSLDVLERTIFTQGLKRDPDAVGRAITRFLEAIGPIDPLDVFGVPGFVPRIGRLRARPAGRFFEEVVGELIARRRALTGTGAEAPHDLLTLLLTASDPETGNGLTDLEVKANIVTFIAAGHETTANALTWALYCLSQDDASRERLEAEADAAVGEDGHFALKNLPFAKAVVEETMRLFPPVPFMSRQAIREDRIGRVKIPKNSTVMVAPWVLHRHRTLWDDPDAFIPERFLPENRETISRFAYLPFGAGPRVCIGQSFSLQEATLVLTHIARAVRLDLAAGHPPVVPLHRVTLRPEDGVRMMVRRRS